MISAQDEETEALQVTRGCPQDHPATQGRGWNLTSGLMTPTLLKGKWRTALTTQLSGFQHEDSFFPSEIVAILQMRRVVILGFSQLGKFIVEKQPKCQHSSKGAAQLYPRRHLYSQQTIFGVQIGTSCNNCSSRAGNNLLRPYCQSSSEKDTFPKSIFSTRVQEKRAPKFYWIGGK